MEYTSLYRKFRPMLFSDMVGQDHITRTLKNQVIQDRVGHAYLFTGSRGTGKTTSAKILSRVVNCLNPKDGEPCNECDICKEAMSGALTDIVELDAASNNSVDDIRSIRDEVNFLPTVAKYRVYIIDEVHMLSTGAFNALLKTLEEPPKHVKFILATTEPQKLPATILSRCQRFDFKKVSNKNLSGLLKKVTDESNIQIDESAIQTIAELAEGGVRDSLSILERCIAENSGNITQQKVKDLVGIPTIEIVNKLVNCMIDYTIDDALKLMIDIIDEGKELNNFVWEMIKYVKDILVCKTIGKLPVYSDEEQMQMKEIANKSDKNRLLKIIFDLSELQNNMKHSTQPSIIFQVGILKLCNKEEPQVIYTQVKPDSKDNNTSNKSNNDFIEPKKQVIHEESKTVVDTRAPIKGKSANFWGSVLEKLKEQRKVMLYSNLLNTSAIEIDDMTVGIQFHNGLNSFGKALIEKPENMNELKKLVSMDFGKDMRIKLIDKKAEEKNKQSNDQDLSSLSQELGIGINIIEE